MEEEAAGQAAPRTEDHASIAAVAEEETEATEETGKAVGAAAATKTATTAETHPEVQKVPEVLEVPGAQEARVWDCWAPPRLDSRPSCPRRTVNRNSNNPRREKTAALLLWGHRDQTRQATSLRLKGRQQQSRRPRVK